MLIKIGTNSHSVKRKKFLISHVCQHWEKKPMRSAHNYLNGIKTADMKMRPNKNRVKRRHSRKFKTKKRTVRSKMLAC